MTETEVPKKSKNVSTAAPFITKTNRKESTDSVFNSAKDRRQSIDSKRYDKNLGSQFFHIENSIYRK